MHDLKSALSKFEKMLSKYPDDTKYSYEFLYFIRSFIRIHSAGRSLPTIELGAILKQEKPNIFYDLKKMSNYNQVIDLITHINMDYQEALERINKIKAE